MISKIRAFIIKVKANDLLLKGILDTNFYFLSNAGAKIINFLIIPIITRLLGLEDFAVYDLFLLYSGVLSMVVGLGMDSGMAIIIAENKHNQKLLSSLFTFSLVATMGLLVTCWGLINFLLIPFYDIPYLNFTVVQYIFVYTVFYQINYNTFSFLRWFGDAKRASILQLLSTASGTVLGLIFLLQSELKSIENFLLGMIIGVGLGSLISLFLSRRFLVADVMVKAQIRELLKLSIPFVPTYLSNYLMQFIDRFIVTYYFGTYGLGLYALSSRIAQIPNLFLQIASKGFQPIIYSNHTTEKGKSLGKLLFNVFTASLVPLSLIVISMSNVLVQIFGGESFDQSIPLVPAVVMSVVIFGAIHLDGYGYVIKRKTQYITYITLGTVFFSGILCVVLAHYFDLFGVAAGMLLASMVGSLCYCYISERLYSFDYNLKLMLGALTGVFLLVLGHYFLIS